MRGALLAVALLLPGCCARATLEARPAAADPQARCDACTGALLDGGWTWPDGRSSCDACHAAAVVDPAVARALLDEARGDLTALGVAAPDAPVTLALVDAPTLQAHAGEGLAHPALQAFSIIDTSSAPRRVRAVRIEALYGLPPEALRGIFVHELFHACQSAGRASSGPVDASFIEGAAQHVQWLALRRRGADGWAARLLENQDPLYGEGLRRFRRLVDARGEARAIELGVTSSGWPPGA